MGGGGLADLSQLRLPRETVLGRRVGGLSARLRSALGGGTLGRRIEPRIRYGHPFLPGQGALGPTAGPSAAAAIARADAVSAGRFAYLGREVAFAERIDWDLATESEAWRIALNRLDDLTAIGIAAAVASEPEARAAWYQVATDLIHEWSERVRPGQGIGWGVPALSGRVANLIHTHAFFAPEFRSDAAVRALLLDALYRQAAALAEAVAGRAADAWQVAAGRALFMAGRFFDGMEARAWLEAGAAILWGQLREQVHDDGGHAGRNPAWHAFVLQQYLEVFAVLRASNDDVPVWGRKRVKGMADFLARIIHPDGTLPAFHGPVPAAVPPPRELLATAAVILHEPALSRPGELPGIWPLLMVGEPGRRAYAHFGRSDTPPAPRALRRTGYYVLTGAPGDQLVLDGDVGATEGHASPLGYELSLAGERMVVDAGPGEGEGPPWSDYFRSPQAHNVVAVAGDGPAPSRQVTDVHWTLRDGLTQFTATLDGLAARAPALRHRRRVVCLPGTFWLVIDEVLGTGASEVETFVHLHPEAVVRATCDGRPLLTATRGPEATLALAFAGGAPVRLVGAVGGARPQGWWSAAPGSRQAAPVASVAVAGPLPLVTGYALVPRPSGTATLDLDHDELQLRATLRIGESVWELGFLDEEVEVRRRPPS